MSAASDFCHQPVLLSQTIEYLAIRSDGIYIDCTLGGGGHSAAILAHLGPGGRLIALDRDADALQAGGKLLETVKSPAAWQTAAGNFSDLDEILGKMDIKAVDGILADLGVSSWQIDQADRGFSYGQEGPLDMRMNRDSGPTAADIVNSRSEADLIRILRDYGEERYAGRIAAAIVDYRSHQPFRTTTELADLVIRAMPGQARRENQHPARRTFQAIRIEVNQELASLGQLLATGPHLLRNGGRMCVITFHSLEDRLVKECFRSLENPCICPRDFPVCTCGRKPLGKVLTRRAAVADPAEQKNNPRSHSARLRCFERRTD
ncbi:MAG TPA: 16S rRNA (cytosine(1402)-N(4))-methyltransferase [Clostridiales bacterium]|nr:16S rRNA (cytosine(1402)-N(4))-methyltransferase [Clostridiales bacterium]